MAAVSVTRSTIVKVVGVTFTPHYPHNLLQLRDVADTAEAQGERLRALLVRNPANQYDANAVEVHVPAMGDLAMIGHIPRDVAARLAPRMDAGDRFIAEVGQVRIDPAHLDRPGIDIVVARIIDGVL